MSFKKIKNTSHPKKSILQIMYEQIQLNGGPTGPLSQALADAYEGKDYDKVYKNKRVIQFRNKISKVD